MAQKPQAEAPKENVEDLVARIPALQAVVELPVFQKFMDVIVPMVDLPKTSQFVLEAFMARDVNAEKLSQAMKGNAYYQQTFSQVVDALSKRKEGDPQPTTEAAIVLMGMQNSRNLILGIQMLRSVMGTHPEWTPEGKLKVAPKEYLKYALAIEEANAGKKDDYLDLAFSAAMLFDVFAMISEAQEHKKKLAPYVDSVYKQGYKTAQIAAEISKTAPDFGFKRYVFAASMVHDIGKVAMAVLDPAYLDFQEELSSKDLPRALKKYAELKRFGINHSIFGALICEYFKVFAPFSRAILYQQDPYLLNTREKKLFDLCALISFSTNICSNFKKIDKLDDPVIERWKTPELGPYKIDMGKVFKAIAKVV